MMGMSTAADAVRVAPLRFAWEWAQGTYRIHFERCRARLAGAACQTCIDLESAEFEAEDAYRAAVTAS